MEVFIDVENSSGKRENDDGDDGDIENYSSHTIEELVATMTLQYAMKIGTALGKGGD